MKPALFFICITINSALSAQIISDFTLQNVSDESTISLSSYSDSKGVVVIFTSNNCPYSKLYENRILELYRAYSGSGLSFILINSNSPQISPEDQMPKMKSKATKKSYPFPYLADKDQKVSKAFSARKNPEAFLLKPNGSQYHIVYRGSIDDNPQNDRDVQNAYLVNAIERLLQNKPIQMDNSRPVGCMIKS